jgi:hypothetical protein
LLCSLLLLPLTIEVCVGRVHMLIAAVSGSKVTNDAAGSKRGKRSLNYFMSVLKADTTALYLCHPCATVTADGAHDSIRLSVSCETHQWLPCCESTSASELLHASDSESEPEEDDDLAANGSAPDANLSAAGGSLATNIKDEVMVDWNAVNGPVVADQQSATYLSSNHANCGGRADGSSTEDAQSAP